MKTRRHHGRGQHGSVSVAFEAIRASLQTKLSLAIQHHQAGRPGEAEPLYLEILATNPRHPDALHLLGVIAHQTGRLDLALTLLEGAVAAEPRMAEFHNDLGTALRDRERLDESAACFQRALALRPDLVPARINLGTILQARGRLDEAVVCYQAAIQLAPDSPEAHNNLGAALYGLGHLEKAIASYRCAVALRPAYATALANLATLYSERGDLPEAESCCRRALALRHDMPGVHGELGKVLGSMGRSDEAVVCYQTVIQLAPDSPEAHNTLAAALWGLGRLDEAIASYRCAVALRPEYAEVANLAMLLRVRGDFAEAEGCCRRALALRPDLAEIHNELGTVLASMHRLDEAVKSLRQAVALRPEDGSLHHQLGAALAGVSRIAEAAASYDRALVLWRSPRSLVSRALLLPVVSESGAAMLAARAQFAEGVETLIRSDLTFTSSELGMAPPAFLLAYHGLDDRALQERVAAFYLGACPSLAWTAPHCARGTRRAGRLRVGFVSTLLQNSTIGVLTRRLIAKLDRDRFEVIVFHGGTWDGMAVAIGESADRAQPLSAALDVAQQQIAAAELDIVFYPDIGMMARTYFLAFARLAPVQCVTWGHPVTTGIPTLDYFVSSEMLEPDGAEAHYAEDLVRLPRLPACYDRPAPATVSVDRARLGLRAGRLYVCPQSLFKLHPDFDGVLGEILDRDGDGRLILIEGDSSHWGELWRARFARGHPQLAPRVDFLPRLNQADFRALLETADVVLDPMHFGGGNSTYEALGLGVPVVTWPGSFMRGRVTYGCYRQMGVMDCVVADPSAYAARAVELATTPDLRAHVSARLRERADALFEDGAAVRALEDFFERAAGIGS